MITKHHDGDEKTKAKVEYQLTDANWHTISGLLSEGKYRDAQRQNDKDYTRENRGGYVRRTNYKNAGSGNSNG